MRKISTTKILSWNARQSSLARILVFCIFIVCSPYIQSTTYEYSIGPQFEDTSNIGGLAGGEGGTVKRVGLDFSLTSQETREWTLQLTSRFENNFYPEDTFEDENIYDFEGSVVYTPQTVNFVVTALATAGQVPINRFQVQDVNNLRDERVFLFQPRYFVSLTRSDRFNFQLAHFDYELDETEELQSLQDSSNTTNSFLVNYEKDINRTNTLSFNIRTAETLFNDTLDPNAVDYNRDDIFLRWIVTGRTNQIQVDLGQSEITDDFGFELSQDLEIVSVTRQVNQYTQVELTYSNSFNNQVFGNQATGSVNVNQQNSLTGVQKVKQYSLVYTYNQGIFNTALNLSQSNIDQVEQTVGQQGNDEDRKSAGITLGYSLTRFFNGANRVQFSLSYAKSEGDFDSDLTNITSNEIEGVSASLIYVFNSNLEMRLTRAEQTTLQSSLFARGVPVETDLTRLSFIYRDNGRF